MNEKQQVGEKAADFILDGMVIGLGTGSTIYYTIQKVGERVKQGLSVQAIATSLQTEQLAHKAGIPLIDLTDAEKLDLAVDGADEVDRHLNLIKGGGGALLREKIIASSAEKLIIAADSSKLVEKLGAFPLPVEVEPFGYRMTAEKLQHAGGHPILRMKDNKPFITDNGHYIFDCCFKQIESPKHLEAKLNLVPGVVDNGLFVEMADLVITLGSDGQIIVKQNNKEEFL